MAMIGTGSQSEFRRWVCALCSAEDLSVYDVDPRDGEVPPLEPLGCIHLARTWTRLVRCHIITTCTASSRRRFCWAAN